MILISEKFSLTKAFFGGKGGGGAWNNDTYKLNKVIFELSNVEIKFSTIEFELKLFALLTNWKIEPELNKVDLR